MLKEKNNSFVFFVFLISVAMITLLTVYEQKITDNKKKFIKPRRYEPMVFLKFPIFSI